MAFGAYGSLTINGASAHLYLSDSGTLKAGMFSAFSSFLDEQGSLSASGFKAFGSAGLTLFDAKDGGSTKYLGTDTISANLFDTVIGGTIIEDKISPTGQVTQVYSSAFQYDFGVHSSFKGNPVALDLFAKAAAMPASAFAGNGVHGASTLAGAMQGDAQAAALVSAPVTLNLTQGSQLIVSKLPTS